MIYIALRFVDVYEFSAPRHTRLIT